MDKGRVIQLQIRKWDGVPGRPSVRCDGKHVVTVKNKVEIETLSYLSKLSGCGWFTILVNKRRGNRGIFGTPVKYSWKIVPKEGCKVAELFKGSLRKGKWVPMNRFWEIRGSEVRRLTLND